MNPDTHRIEVWKLLSELWTDNEPQLCDLVAMAQQLAASPYSPEELEHIYAREVAPAFADVMISGALSGGMAVTALGYPDAEIERRLHRWLNPSAASKLNPFRFLAARYGPKWARRDWNRVVHHVQYLREQGNGGGHR